MNVQGLLTLANITADDYIEVPEADASAALVGDVVIVTIRPSAGEPEIAVSVHSHGGDRDLAVECFTNLRAKFDAASMAVMDHALQHTAVNASYFV